MPPLGLRTLRIAVVDDDEAVRELMRATLERVGATVDLFPGSQLFLDRAIFTDYDVIFCDLMLPGMSGIDLLFEVRGKAPAVPFVIISGQAAVSDAIEAMKAGATDFIVKPFRIQSLLDVVKRLTQDATPRMASGIWRREKEQNFAVGNSASWKSLLEKARRVAELSSTVLIRGETGTGKEVIAKYIASFGPRAGKPFVTLNCAAIPDDLIESELFGHVRGAFTGAVDTKVGLFEHADGGTLFLDEAGELPLALQAKLLRAVEYGEVQPVGSLETRRVDVHVIAATNRDLRAEAAAGPFRTDLFYRLSVIEIHVPALRERREDIPYLSAHFTKESARRLKRPITGISPAAERLLQHAAWPGNVRELRNAIERACILSEAGIITERELGTALSAPPASPAPDTAPDDRLSTLQQHQIERVLEEAGGNKSQAARRLGISRRALYRRIDEMTSEK